MSPVQSRRGSSRTAPPDQSSQADHPSRKSPRATRLVSFDQKRSELTPGTILVREWDRQSQRVMVMSDGFAWNGQTYDSFFQGRFCHHGHPVERSALLWSQRQRGSLGHGGPVM